MTHEEIRAQLFQVSFGLNQGSSVAILNGNDPNFLPYQQHADRLLAAHLEITKPLADAAEELAAALGAVLTGVTHIATWKKDNWPEPGTDHEIALHALKATVDYDMWCCWNAAMLHRDALARYRAVKWEV